MRAIGVARGRKKRGGALRVCSRAAIRQSRSRCWRNRRDRLTRNGAATNRGREKPRVLLQKLAQLATVSAMFVVSKAFSNQR